MAFDSTIRIKQINQAELSGFVTPIVLGFLANTGSLSGIFYPLYDNPNEYLQSGAFISQSDLDSAIYQYASSAALTYYPLNNPSGFISSSLAAETYYPINNPSGFINSIILSSNFPSTSTSSGIMGQMAINGDYLYVATGTNQWGKVALSSF